ncbi:Serine palmitoyltransferase 2 [Operophtera brumata]|uniref:serine C-palmitoyltransferase n=1 Tax=Operophtera brumata TaxID=104452 RepID=A0A0L7LMR5_OPEBR|nr:Serine palmitoyltransferase 2 [Operophtera brumata]
MEGSIVPLAALVALKKRLGLQLYLDEAHSVGAMGARGRGVTEHARVPPADVDVLMGTFTKSFGAAGGYIAGSRRLIAGVRARGHAHTYAHAMAPPVAAQVLAATRILQTAEGRARDSPVVPLLVYSFSKMAATVERLTAHGVATVGVGFPATPLDSARIRY